MTGPEHYRDAESLLIGIASPHATNEGVRRALAAAQVHATLALAAVTALAVAHDMPVADHDAWWAAAGSEPVYREDQS